MPVTLKQLAALLDEAETKYELNEERQTIAIPVSPDCYKAEDSEESLLILVTVPKNQSSVQAMAPSLYRFPEGGNGVPFSRALLVASRRAKFTKWTLDPADDTIDAIANLVVADAEVTKDQFLGLLSDLFSAIDYYHPMIQHALEAGEVVEPDPEDSVVAEILKEVASLAPGELIQLQEALNRTHIEADAPAEETL